MRERMSCAFVTFASQVVSKVRWNPMPSGFLQSGSCERFVTGSWNEGPDNKIGLWSYKKSDGNANDSANEELNLIPEPTNISDLTCSGDVREIKFLAPDVFAVALSNGSVDLYAVQENKHLKLLHTWKNLHYFHSEQAPCTSLAVRNEDIATVGEDGRLVVLNANEKKVVDLIDDADSCSLMSAMFVRQIEIATGNIRGHLKIWDLRCVRNTQPARSLLISGNQVPVMYMDQHPTQQYVVAIGGGNGMLYFWDLRQERQPITAMEGHKSPLTEVKFHPSEPNHVFTSSMDNGMWQWTISGTHEPQGSLMTTSKLPTTATVKENVSSISGNLWTSFNSSTHSLDILSLLPQSVLPMNSFDVDDTTLICSSENGALYVVRDLKL